MKDFYSERLEGLKKTKEARLQSLVGLPLNTPGRTQDRETSNTIKTLAGKPNEPQQEQQPDNSLFKQVFDNYSKDPSFKQGTAEFATIMNALKGEVEGLGLPKEILQRKVMGVIDQFKNRARGPQLQQPAAMGDVVPEQAEVDTNGL